MMQMSQTRDDLLEMSRNIRARVGDRMAEDAGSTSVVANELHWLAVLREELALADEEAVESNRLDPEAYRAGYDQGWVDAMRVILDAADPKPGRRDAVARKPGLTAYRADHW
jgi:hypothetical protein